MSSGMDRRTFFKAIGVGSAATAAACTTRVPEKIIPYVVAPENQIPGESLWYASVCTECEVGCGTLVRNREGRALKIEGNPEHPANRGALCARGHSSLQAEYHPDRYRGPKLDGRDADWDAALSRAAEAVQAGSAAVLLGDIGPGALSDLFREFAEQAGVPLVRWSAIHDEPLLLAAETIFGQAVRPHFNFAAADHILSFGADFLETWGNPVANQRGFAEARRIDEGRMARTVQVEPRMSLTAANADEWLAAKPGSEAFVAAAVLGLLIEAGAATGLSAAEVDAARAWTRGIDAAKASAVSGLSVSRIETMARELAAANAPLVVAGGAGVQHSNASALQVATLLINKARGVVGNTVGLAALSRPGPRDVTAGFRKLLDDIDAGRVQTLVVYAADPVFTAPASWKVAERFRKLRNLIVLDAMPSETSALAQVILPDHGPLEGWGDHRGYQGFRALRQPAMNPLWDTRAAGDTLLDLLRATGVEVSHESFHARLRADWQAFQRTIGNSDDPEAFWRASLVRGGAEDPTAPPAATGTGASLDAIPLGEAERNGQAELHLMAYPHVFRYDGRLSNRGWMQEVPDPLIQTAWSNWVEIHPVTARRLGIGQGDEVELATETGRIRLHAYITSGVLPEVLAVPLGQGHSEAIGRYGSDIEGNPFTLLADLRDTASDAWVLGGNTVSVKRVAKAQRKLVSKVDVNLVTVDGGKQDLGRGIAQVVALNEIRAYNSGEKTPPTPPQHGTQVPKDGFYPPQDHPTYHWGMAVDINACTGCGGCVAACYSENNIPVVGKEQVAVGRRMAWIRIERYYEGDDVAEGVKFVPMMCQQCDNAPCEPVCPVVATYHTVDGLNGMVYNRCVGTRFCGNNCSYKVRRFNYWGYDDPENPYHAWPEPMSLMMNPDVSVRYAGVMEKCTFCVQRIREVTEPARLEGRTAADGEIAPACAQSCPSDAIVFGNMKDPDSRVSQIARETNRGYKVLDILNTQPSVTYLRKVRWTGESA